MGFSWRLKPEANELVHDLVPSIENILFSKQYFQATDKESYFLSQYSVAYDKIKQIAELTIGQHKNESWPIMRKHRLTASKFGLVIKTCQREKYSSLFKSLLEGFNLDRVLAIKWGKDNEQTTITNDAIIVDSTHNYYHQIQGQLYLTNRKDCYFFVWTPKEFEVLILEKDEE